MQTVVPHESAPKVGFLTSKDIFDTAIDYVIACGYSPVFCKSIKELNNLELRVAIADTQSLNRTTDHLVTPIILLCENEAEEKTRTNELLNNGAITHAPITSPPRALVGMIDTGIKVIERDTPAAKILALTTPETKKHFEGMNHKNILPTSSIDDIFWRLQNNQVGAIYLDAAAIDDPKRALKRLHDSYPSMKTMLGTGDQICTRHKHPFNQTTMLPKFNQPEEIAYNASYEILEDILNNAAYAAEDDQAQMTRSPIAIIVLGPRSGGKSVVTQVHLNADPNSPMARRFTERPRTMYEFPGQEFLRTMCSEDAAKIFFSYMHRKGYRVSFPQSEVDAAFSKNKDALFIITNPDAAEELTEKLYSQNIPVYTALINATPDILRLRSEDRGASIKTVTQEEAERDAENYDRRRDRYDITVLNTYHRQDAANKWGPFNPSPDTVLDIELIARCIRSGVRSKYPIDPYQ